MLLIDDLLQIQLRSRRQRSTAVKSRAPLRLLRTLSEAFPTKSQNRIWATSERPAHFAPTFFPAPFSYLNSARTVLFRSVFALQRNYYYFRYFNLILCNICIFFDRCRNCNAEPDVNITLQFYTAKQNSLPRRFTLPECRLVLANLLCHNTCMYYVQLQRHCLDKRDQSVFVDLL